jgi:hypothetical protein
MLNTSTLHYVTRFIDLFPNILTDKKLIAAKMPLIKGIQKIPRESWSWHLNCIPYPA